MAPPSSPVAAWAASGAMALTGPADGPPSPTPAAVAVSMAEAAADLARCTARWGRRVEVDGAALLGERAAITGMTRRGDVSVGGAARFVRAADDWVVLNLPRADDVAALPALVGESIRPDDWPAVASRLAALDADTVVETAGLLGLAVARPGRGPRPSAPGWEAHPGGPRRVVARPLVVDLTSLWAGPLAASLLGAAGARVIKVEGRNRPDGARRGPSAFFDLLNHGRECLTLDLDDPADVALLRRLVTRADLVLEGSRPRVMERLGLDPAAVADAGTGWLSITAHGRSGPAARRIGFGDDAAVAGGLWLPGDPPGFVADAVADPIAGLAAAAAAARLLGEPRAAVLEVPLATAAGWARGRPVEAEVRARADGWVVDVAGAPAEVAAPRHRRIPGRAPAAGSHDAALRAEFAASQVTRSHVE